MALPAEAAVQDGPGLRGRALQRRALSCFHGQVPQAARSHPRSRGLHPLQRPLYSLLLLCACRKSSEATAGRLSARGACLRRAGETLRRLRSRPLREPQMSRSRPRLRHRSHSPSGFSRSRYPSDAVPADGRGARRAVRAHARLQRVYGRRGAGAGERPVVGAGQQFGAAAAAVADGLLFLLQPRRRLPAGRSVAVVQLRVRAAEPRRACEARPPMHARLRARTFRCRELGAGARGSGGVASLAWTASRSGVGRRPSAGGTAATEELGGDDRDGHE